MTHAKNSYLLAVIISFATFALYLGACEYDFVNWDDPDYVLENYHLYVRDWTFIKWAFSNLSLGNWHPVTWMSHALDRTVWGLNPFGHHLTNIIIHALNSLLIVVLYVKLRNLWSGRVKTGLEVDEKEGLNSLIGAGVAGILFGLHPVHVESVVWVSERKDLLCGLFFILSLITYADHVCHESRDPASVQLRSLLSLMRSRNYLMSVSFCVLALMSKPMAVSLPVVLLIIDWYPGKRIHSVASFWTAILAKVPFILPSVAVSILTIAAQEAVGAMELMNSVPFWSRVIVAVRALVSYLGHMVLPLDLSPFYPFPKPHEITMMTPQDFAAYGLVFAIIVILVAVVKDRMLLLSAASYYVITLVPVIGIVHVGLQSMADRYTYLPSIGPFFIVGSVAAGGWGRSAVLRKWTLPVRFSMFAVTAVVLVLMSLTTLRQMSVWRNSIDLWSFVIKKSPDHVAFAYMNRGIAYAEQGKTELAFNDYNRSIELDPSSSKVYNNRGVLYEKIGQLDRARDDYTAAIFRASSNAFAYNNRGTVHVELGQLMQAMDDYNMAVSLNDCLPSAFSNRGVLLAQMGQYAPAIRDLTKAISLNPDHADYYVRRGRTFKEQGNYEQALRDYDTAISLDPGKSEAYNGRGVVYKNMDQLERALNDYDAAITLNPSLYLAYCNRAVVLGRMGRYEKAITDYTKAATLQPNVGKIYLERGRLFATTGKWQLAATDYRKACGLGSREGCDALK